jgi:predicted XRE-type DNA-binding protein
LAAAERGRADASGKAKLAMSKRAKKSNGTAKEVRVQKSSGNVFADLGMPHPEQELLKAKLTLQIYRLIKGRGITQTEAGKILGIQQPHVSALMRNRSGSFSVERLIEFLTALDQDVEISVRPARGHGEVSVVV